MNNKQQSEVFIIEYDYFGLSTSAEVREVKWLAGSHYRCNLSSFELPVDIGLNNDSNNHFWIDLNMGTPTHLAQILGQAIENKIGPVQALTTSNL